jgi:hypothetical protein
MLKNIQYTGAYVSGTFLYDKTKGKRYHIPKCDWVIIPDKFPPIISKEKFDEVQNILEQNAERRKNMRPRDFLLRGNIVKCGCCGCAMYFDSVKNPQFRCRHILSDGSAECHKLKISVQELDKIVLKIIKKQAKIIFNTDISNLKINTTTKNISDFEKEIGLQISAQQKLYERFILGEISKEIFQTEKSECSEKIDYFNSQISILKQAENDKFSHKKSAELANKILSEKLSEREIIELLIDKIFIFPNNRIEIKWKISDFTQPYK